MAGTVRTASVVVGAAILAGGRVLAAQRSYPSELAGRWEFPGGKVRPGEPQGAALARELREELGVRIAVGRRLAPDLPTVGGTAVLRVHVARLLAGTPTRHEHQALRWLDGDELDDLEWLDADRPLLTPLRGLLADRLGSAPLPFAAATRSSRPIG